jgi:hypothetical protein
MYFLLPFGVLLGLMVCNEGLLVDQAKIVVIIDITTPMTMKALITTLGHIGYYKKNHHFFTKVEIPLEKLLKKDVKFV